MVSTKLKAILQFYLYDHHWSSHEMTIIKQNQSRRRDRIKGFEGINYRVWILRLGRCRLGRLRGTGRFRYSGHDLVRFRVWIIILFSLLLAIALSQYYSHWLNYYYAEHLLDLSGSETRPTQKIKIYFTSKI